MAEMGTKFMMEALQPEGGSFVVGGGGSNTRDS
jgi:hypothetical protein